MKLQPPTWIAHRGGGTLAPENTLAAFRTGAAMGYRAFECDAKLSADGVCILMHDSDLRRTTNERGWVRKRSWCELSRLDAGSWHSPMYAGEPVPTLEAVLRWCAGQGFSLNVEIKPDRGLEEPTAHAVAAQVREVVRVWRGARVWLSSFSVKALTVAMHSAPELPRALLVRQPDPSALTQALEMGCMALNAHRNGWTPEWVARVHDAGMSCAAYTVNRPAQARTLLDWGMDSLFTDSLDLFAPVCDIAKRSA